MDSDETQYMHLPPNVQVCRPTGHTPIRMLHSRAHAPPQDGKASETAQNEPGGRTHSSTSGAAQQHHTVAQCAPSASMLKTPKQQVRLLQRKQHALTCTTNTLSPQELGATNELVHGPTQKRANPVLTPPPIVTPKMAAKRMATGLKGLGFTLLAAATSPTETRAAEIRNDEIEPRNLARFDPPLQEQPSRFSREINLPIQGDFTFPRFAFCALGEHSGEEREAMALQTGRPTCSVANQRTSIEPSGQSFHFIGSIRDFLNAYTFPIDYMCGAQEGFQRKCC